MPSFNFLGFEPTPSFPNLAFLTPRDDSSSSSDHCAESPHAADCQKPVSMNLITIVVAIIIPVVCIAIILGVLLFMNYRKDKKESLEHDPDFDETGDATALPDFVPTNRHADPFANKAESHHPSHLDSTSNPNSNPDNQAPLYKHNNLSTIDSASVVADPYLDNFVLPYHHETGSRVSLDEYARQLGENLNYSHSSAPTPSSSRPQLYVGPPGSRPSPQKSRLSRQIWSHQGHVPTSHSNLSLDSVVNSRTNLNFAAGRLHLAVNLPLLETHPIGIRYENESLSRSLLEPAPVSSILRDNPHDSNATTLDEDLIAKLIAQGNTFDNDQEEEEDLDDNRFLFGGPERLSGFARMSRVSSLVGDSGKSYTRLSSDRPSPTDRVSAYAKLPADSPVRPLNVERAAVHGAPDDLADTSIDSAADDSMASDPDHAHDFNRVKSVYKVYFNDNDDPADAPPLPKSPLLHSRLDTLRAQQGPANRALAATATSAYPESHHEYEKHYPAQWSTAASSGEFHDAQEFPYEPHALQPPPQQQSSLQQQYPQPSQQQYPQQSQQQYPPQQHPQQQPPLKQPHHTRPQQAPQQPLKLLRNASDHRMSSIDTYTDFAPRHKSVALPVLVPAAAGLSWGSPFELGVLASGPQNLVPSASQLSRKLVAMTDPIGGIPQSKGFKPAGSARVKLPTLPMSGPGLRVSLPTLPSGTVAGTVALFNSARSLQNDLIPGNRKSDVRRMMNTNF